MNENDIFRELQIFFGFCKAIGVIYFDIVGPPYQRVFIHRRSNMVALVFKFIIITILYACGTTQKLIKLFTCMSIKEFPEMIINFSFFALSILVLVYQLFFQKYIINTFYILQDLLKGSYVKIDYIFNKKIVFCILIIKFQILLPTIFDLFIYKTPVTMIFFNLCEITTVLVTTQFCLMLMTNRDLLKKLNDSINEMCLQTTTHLHLDIFNLLKRIDRVLFFLTVRFFMFFFVLFTLCIYFQQ